MKHIITSTGAPTAAPTDIGQHYINLTNGDCYISKGTAVVGDWGSPLGSGGGGSGFTFYNVGNVSTSATINPANGNVQRIAQMATSITLNIQPPATANAILKLIIINEWSGANTFTIALTNATSGGTIFWDNNVVVSSHSGGSFHRAVELVTFDTGVNWYAYGH